MKGRDKATGIKTSTGIVSKAALIGETSERRDEAHNYGLPPALRPCLERKSNEGTGVLGKGVLLLLRRRSLKCVHTMVSLREFLCSIRY